MKNGQNYNSALCPVSITDSVLAYEAVEVWVQIPSGAPINLDSGFVATIEPEVKIATYACLFQLVEKADSKSV